VLGATEQFKDTAATYIPLKYFLGIQAVHHASATEQCNVTAAAVTGYLSLPLKDFCGVQAVHHAR